MSNETKFAPTLRKSILLVKDFTGGQSAVVEDLNKVKTLLFTPDEMIIRSIAYMEDKTGVRIFDVYCRETASYLGSVNDGSISAPGTTIWLTEKPDKLTIELRELDQISTAPTGNLSLLIEFVRHPRAK